MKELVISLSALLTLTSTHAQEFLRYFDGKDALSSWCDEDYNSTICPDSLEIHIDNSTTNIWQIGKPDKSFLTSFSEPNTLTTKISGTYPVNNKSSFTIDLPGVFVYNWRSILDIQWMQQMHTTRKKDGGYIEFSIDSGATWENVFNSPYIYNFYGYNTIDTLVNGETGFSGIDSSFNDVWLCFDGNWLGTLTNLTLRFTFVSDSIDEQMDGWIIDNLMVRRTMIHTVQTVEQAKYFNVSPNPTTGRVNIETQKKEGYHIIENMVLTDANSKVLKTWKNIPTKFFIDINNQEDGVYFLTIQTNHQKETFKLILKK